LQSGFAGGWKLEWVSAWNDDATTLPELRMNQEWQVRSSKRTYQSIKSRSVIEMAVAEHDSLDVLGRAIKHLHIFNKTIRCHARIEEYLMLALE
jgi:hypothetical protein